MLRWIIAALLASPLLVTAAAPAQDKPAEPKPSSKTPPAKPDPVKKKAADETALRDALKTLAKALQEGNAERIRQVIHAADPTERKMVDAMAAMAVQIAQLYKASAKAFGEDQAKGLTGDVTAEMSRIDGAEVSIEGDTATVRYAQEPPAPGDEAKPGEKDDAPAVPPPPMVLKKVDGRWRVPMSELSKGSTPEEIEQRLSDLEAQTKIIAELTTEIAAGKYKSAEKAAEAWQGKMMQALTPPRKAEPERPKADEPAKADKPQGEKPK
jgi:hypothetical protein